MARTLHEVKRSFEETILDGCARTLWVLAYADFAAVNAWCLWCGERIWRDGDGGEWQSSPASGGHQCPDAEDASGHAPDSEDPAEATFPVPESGNDWDDVAPATPAVAITCAKELIAASSRADEASIADLFEIAMTFHQGEWEWVPENRRGHKDSRQLNEDKDTQHGHAAAFGSGIAAQFMDQGFGWGDDHKTRRGDLEFQLPRIPGEFRIDDFDRASWSVGSVRGADTIQRHIGIGGTDFDKTALPVDLPFSEWIDVDPDDLQGFDSVPEWCASAMADNAHDIKASTESPQPNTYFIGTVQQRDRDTRPRRELTFHLLGMTDDEKEWIFYFVTKSIGRITLVSTPSSGDYDYGTRRRGQGFDGVSDGNILFWFGQGHQTLLLAFTNSEQDGLDACVDWLEDNEPGRLVDDEVNEKLVELQRAALEAKGVKIPDMPLGYGLREQAEDELSEREISRLHEEAEEGTTTAGNHGRYLSIGEFGMMGQNLTTEELRKIGFRDDLPAWLRTNPDDSVQHMRIADIKRAASSPDQRRDTVRVTPLDFAQRPSPSSSRSSAAQRRRR